MTFWRRHRDEAEKARRELADAEKKARAAEERRKQVDRLVRRAATSSAQLHVEITQNRFSELMQEAWGRR